MPQWESKPGAELSATCRPRFNGLPLNDLSVRRSARLALESGGLIATGREISRPRDIS
jgi:hypothetical protein